MKTQSIGSSKDFKLIAKARRIKRFYSKRLRKYGLSYEGYTIMLLTSENGRINQKIISRYTGNEPSTLSRIIDIGLFQKGLVRKNRCKEDYRIWWISLTKKGKKLLNKISSEFSEMEKTSTNEKLSA